MAGQNPNADRQDPNVEMPGDTGATDIVGPTGEEMPQQSHDEVDVDDRSRPAPATSPDEDKTAGPSGC